MMVGSLAPSRQLVSARDEQDSVGNLWTIPALGRTTRALFIRWVRYAHAQLRGRGYR